MVSHGAHSYSFIVALLLLTTSLLIIFPSFSAAQKMPYIIQVAHRHGARTPIVPYNKTLVCSGGHSIGCGQLTLQGAQMLNSLGKFIRSKYGSYFDFDTYNPNLHYSRSTDIPRTLQSADALLTGLFNAPVTTSFLPVVHTRTLFSDKLLLIDALAGCYFPMKIYWHDIYTNVSNNVVLKLFTTAELKQMARETYQNDLCVFSKDKPWVPAECAEILQDLAASFNSDGGLNQFPTLKRFWENGKLNQSVLALNQVKFSFNPQNSRDAAVGSCGQNLAKQIIQNIRQAYAGNISYQFLEYSAHDSTITPLYVTLGHSDMMLPPFAQMVLFEGLFDQSASGETLFIKGYQGYPTQEYGSDHNYHVEDFLLYCMKKDGQVYTTTSNCPLDDFERFVARSDPKSECGLCYLDAAALRAIQCDKVGTPPDPSGMCHLYRTLCPESGCPVGYYLDPTSLGCYYIATDVDTTSSYSATTLAIAIALAIVGGVMIGFVAAKLTTMKKADAEETAYKAT